MKKTVLAIALVCAAPSAFALKVGPAMNTFTANEATATLKIHNPTERMQTYQTSICKASAIKQGEVVMVPHYSVGPDNKQVVTEVQGQVGERYCFPTQDLRTTLAMAEVQPQATISARFLRTSKQTQEEEVYVILVSQVVDPTIKAMQFASNQEPVWIWRQASFEPNLIARWEASCDIKSNFVRHVETDEKVTNDHGVTLTMREERKETKTITHKNCLVIENTGNATGFMTDVVGGGRKEATLRGILPGEIKKFPGFAKGDLTLKVNNKPTTLQVR